MNKAEIKKQLKIISQGAIPVERREQELFLRALAGFISTFPREVFDGFLSELALTLTSEQLMELAIRMDDLDALQASIVAYLQEKAKETTREARVMKFEQRHQIGGGIVAGADDDSVEIADMTWMKPVVFSTGGGYVMIHGRIHGGSMPTGETVEALLVPNSAHPAIVKAAFNCQPEGDWFDLETLVPTTVEVAKIVSPDATPLG